jgi:uroporphyrinogen decarboxylase
LHWEMKFSACVTSLTSVLERKAVWPPPVWLMRQAGRYLPEYQAVRKKAGSFWTMCMTPDLAVEVTLQPIDRFDFDAAILFSDILVIPYALGQPVRFEEGVGPILDVFAGETGLVRNPALWEQKLAPVYAAMHATRTRLGQGKSLIGFAGAPWTLAAYMLQGRGSPDQRAAKLFAYQEPDRFSQLLELLADAVVFHLARQLDEGADTVQLFDSWAGGLPDEEFGDWVIKPTAKIVAGLRKRHINARIIGFPRAATQSQYERYVAATGVNGISIDTATSIDWAAEILGDRVAIQGNLDPVVLIAGGTALDNAVDRILREARSRPFIFNLGHGVLPETPVANVARLVQRIRGAT